LKDMKAYLLFTSSGPVLVLTAFDFVRHPELLARLAAEISKKFIAHELPIDAVKASYSAHFAHVLSDPNQTGDIKVLDDDGREIFTNVRFKDLSAPIYYDPE
jgi:hypothetical protein